MQFFGERPRASSLEPLLTMIVNIAAPESKPEQQRDQVRVQFLEIQQTISYGFGAREDVDAAFGHVLDDESSVNPPEDIGEDPGVPGIRAPRTRRQYRPRRRAVFRELDDQLRRLLKIRRHHRKN